jgi:deazaflavin-dependent oxidoreductase (nitroreductase family)
MTTTTDRSSWNHGLIDDYRANGRPTSGPFVGRQVLLLTTRGAQSGEDRTAPLAYSTDGDRIVIVASMGGAPTNPHWFTNLRANPLVTVELGTELFPARATVVDDPLERRRLYDQHAALHASFADYEKRTERVIPVVVLERTGSGA